MPARDQVTVPAQDRVRSHQQPHTPKNILREAVQERVGVTNAFTMLRLPPMTDRDKDIGMDNADVRGDGP